MDLTDLQAGLSLHFNAPLPLGPRGAPDPSREYDEAVMAMGAIVATPQSDWDTLKGVLALPERAKTGLRKDFSVAYVPYTDAFITYYEGNAAVLSMPYSGCLMAVYRTRRHRRVAHVPKSHAKGSDCIGVFRDFFDDHSTLSGVDKGEHVKKDYKLEHYFQPFIDRRDGAIQLDLIGKLISKGVIVDPYGFAVWGLITARENAPVSIWAVKPKIQPASGEIWHIVMVRARARVLDFKEFAGKTNRAVA